MDAESHRRQEPPIHQPAGRSQAKMGKLGILAGRGHLPWMAARRALAAGEDVVIFYYIHDEHPPEDLQERTRRVVLTRMFRSVLGSLRKENVRRLLLLGKATRDILYNRPAFDLKTIYVLARIKNTGDTTIFEGFAREFEKQGIEILPQTLYLGDMFLKEGRYGKSCNARELRDVEFGMYYAREMTRLDIGQTVVVGGRAVLAVEGAEGTDRCIRRGGELYHGKGAVVCKAGKVDHDPRFDLPVSGFDTLDSLSESGCRVFVMDAEHTMAREPGQFIAEARKRGITVVSVDPARLEKEGMEYLKKINHREIKPA